MDTSRYTVDMLKRIFVEKIIELYQNEYSLFSDKLCERAIVFRLGARMLNAFQGCTVYSEYNKAHSPDGTTGYKNIPGKIHTYPDLIVVSDSESGRAANKLMIEAKWSSNKDIATDLNKLKWYTDSSFRYDYTIAAHLFIDENYFLLAWYENGFVNTIESHIRHDGNFIKKSMSWNKEYISSGELKAALDCPE